MPKSTLAAALLSITLDRTAGAPLKSQLSQELRHLVHSGRLGSGDPLPSSRLLAAELAVSRITVTAAYDQLIAEGYLQARRGSGVSVASPLPDRAIAPPSAEAARVAAPPPPPAARPFETGAPDLRAFPHREWARLLDLAWRAPEPALTTRPDPFGWGPLRAAIAGHLRDWRGVVCNPEHILITSGLVESMALIADAALAPGDAIVVEEPSHGFLRETLRRSGLAVTPTPVDAQGLDIAAAPTVGPNGAAVRAVVLTPSRQFPLGATLPLSRRLAVLAWAEAMDGLVIEDDFDGEYRYQGAPPPALTSLDDRQCVLYVGSFSKVMSPALRLGYVAAPPRLAPSLARAVAATGPRASLTAQPALARFIAEGGFATHLRRMRRLYLERQRRLLDRLQADASDLLSVAQEPGGMHMVARLRPELARPRGAEALADVALSEAARAAGVIARPLSRYYAGPQLEQGFVLGYAGYTPEELDDGVAALLAVLRRAAQQ